MDDRDIGFGKLTGDLPFAVGKLPPDMKDRVAALEGIAPDLGVLREMLQAVLLNQIVMMGYMLRPTTFAFDDKMKAEMIAQITHTKSIIDRVDSVGGP